MKSNKFSSVYDLYLHQPDGSERSVPLGPGFVPVARVLDHVEPGELGLAVVVELLLLPRHRLPPGAQDLGDVGVVQLRAVVQDLPPLVLGPDHEGIHRSLDVVFLIFARFLLLFRLLKKFFFWWRGVLREEEVDWLTESCSIVSAEAKRDLLRNTLRQTTHHLPLMI